MSTTLSSPSRSDRISLIATIVIGIVAAGYILVLLVLRLIEVLPNREVPVLVPFVEMPTRLPIGPDGADIAANVEQATVSVSGMPTITVVSLAIAAIVTAASAIAIIAIVCIFCRRLIRGEAFSARNTRLIMATSFTLIGGWFLGTLFTNMGVNGAFSHLSDYGYDGATFTADWVPAVAAIAIGAVGIAFQAGQRLQRETEGLV